MFKSIFTKYMVAFMSVIIFSFTLLAFIVGSIVTNYSVNERKTITAKSATTVKDYLESEMNKSVANDIQLFIFYNHAELRQTLTLFTSYEKDIMLLLVDCGGNVLITDKLADSEYVNATIPESIVNEVISGNTVDDFGTIGGLFETKHLFHATVITDKSNTPCGALFAISTDSSLTKLSSVMIRAVIFAMLCVMVTALIPVYYLSKRITDPLKKISNAAHAFAKGDFSVRVNVVGNDEIAQLSESFNSMAEELQNQEKTRSAFIANISHDLRTPMTSISGFIDSMLEGAIPPDKYSHYLQIVATEMKRLSRLVSTLLEISKFEAGERKLNISEFDICEMARQIVISFEKKIEEKNLNVEFDLDDFNINVKADKDKIYQILYNICDNGIKFSKESGKYVVSVREKGKQVFVSVFNEGIGISSEDLPFIFDRFYKSDRSRGLDKTGVGLGLYICKTIVEAHGQEIWARSVYGEYCEFVFTLEKA